MAVVVSSASGGNQALEVNPPSLPNQINLTTNGSNWYWTVFCIFGALTIGYTIWGWYVPRKERSLHYLSIFSAMVAAVTYFTLASNLGYTYTAAEFSHYMSGDRQVFYARYIGWFIVSSLFFIILHFFAGVYWVTTMFSVATAWMTVVCALIGTLVSSTYKWGYFTFGVAAGLLLTYQLIFVCRPSAKELGTDIARHFDIAVGSFLVLFLLYPICWGISEGGNVISPTSEGVFYGVLDILALAGVNTYVLYAARHVTYSRLGLATDSPAKSVEKEQVADARLSAETATHV
ncbi:hypothetical protein CANCADRAFT_140092 [Tortispora caseinolytica NRRL Y-17796]|uniref:Uncharacterized protein n=1 Tax=Tortispora caseinolytica NRRL Y-17796 TaxID=767744 RepID=A0A1E4TCP7_9ASCO|nr:hypothetical protein CANCADRAFT_140092 [Tortispora caseinolytica NRRL Y-17796]